MSDLKPEPWPPEAIPLLVEWAEMESKDLAIARSLRTAPDGRTLYAVTCKNGDHVSYESHVAALREMVEAHR